MVTSANQASLTTIPFTCIPDVLVTVSIALMTHHNQKAGWGGKGVFGLCFQITVHLKEVRTRTQNKQEPGAEADAGVRKGATYWLPY